MTNVVRSRSEPVAQGRDDGPARASCEILDCRALGSYRQLTLVAPHIASRARPGQFVTVGVDVDGALLRRPFSIAGVSQRGPWAGTLDIVFSEVGPGTAWLAARDKHEALDVVGPLGRPFPTPRQQVRCVLVGGGYGAAPMLYLARELLDEGLKVDLLLGAATHDRLFNAIEAKRLATTAHFVTEDGTLGFRGLVTDALPELLAATRAGVVYACGPMGMLGAVSLVAEERGLPCQVAVEEHMACGVGVCMTCVVPYRRRDGLANVRACVEGPVLDGKKVRWDAIGTPSMSDARGEVAP